MVSTASDRPNCIPFGIPVLFSEHAVKTVGWVFEPGSSPRRRGFGLPFGERCAHGIYWAPIDADQGVDYGDRTDRFGQDGRLHRPASPICGVQGGHAVEAKQPWLKSVPPPRWSSSAPRVISPGGNSCRPSTIISRRVASRIVPASSVSPAVRWRTSLSAPTCRKG